MDLCLKDKVVMITGGTSGLGKETAILFAEEGAHVAITCKDKFEAAKKTIQLLETHNGTESKTYYCELAEESSIREAFASVLSDFGKIDILINNAAYFPTAYVHEMVVADWKACLDVNLTGHFIMSQLFVKYLLERKRKGKIVNIVYFAGIKGSTTGHAHYASAKAGLITFTKSLAREVSSSGINVNAVSPGMMYTDMVKPMLEKNLEMYLDRIPLGRIAYPSEVANSVVFLSSERADYITGTTLDVSGGLLMH